MFYRADFIFIIVLVCFINSTTCGEAVQYCTPQNSTCWPKQVSWDDFRKRLTGELHRLNPEEYGECVKQGDDAFKISDTGNGICMQYHDCSKEFCNAKLSSNIPEYSVEVKTVKDIQLAIEFANNHSIAVTIKTSGHSYSGSSMGKGTLLIWMHKFIKYGDIKHNHSDSCETVHDHTVKVGGGQPWDDIYKKLGSDYHIIGGGGLTVSAAGGWLQGCGLSAMSRKYGIGIDNVLNFEVVLANGSHVLADACTNTDLFWALRGGGGGTWGVVTSVHYKIRPAENVTHLYMEIKNIESRVTTTVDSWLEKWVELSPNLDKRWGGYWTLNVLIMYFIGGKEDAMITFGNGVQAWKDSLPKEEEDAVILYLVQSNSYFDSRGGVNMTTDKTGQASLPIASRLIPRDWVVNNPKNATETLRWLVRNGFFTFNYFLGGAVSEVAGDTTAVNPAMRKAIWQIETFDKKMIQKLRDEVKDTGAGYNHAAKDEPDWRNAFWGSNLERLQSLKREFDPNNRFNCWHCVGYQGPEPKPVPSKPSAGVIVAATRLFVIASILAFIVHN